MKQHKIYLDILNVLACISVIYMHCNGIVHSFSNTTAWKQSMIIETIAYWAVPVFFMISGATLLNYRDRYDTKTYLKKRIIRVGLPFIIWSTINLMWKLKVGKIVVADFTVSSLITLYLNSQIENVYWFFIPLFAVYFSIPVLSKIVRERRILNYMMVLGFATYSVFPTMFSVLGITYNSSLNFPLTGGYVLYVLLGYYLDTEEISLKRRSVIYLFAVLGAGIRYFSTIYFSVKTGEIYKMFWGYLNFPTVVLSMGVFVLIKYIKWDKIFNTLQSIEIISNISSTSFGIYLIHMIIMNGFWYVGVDTHGLKWRILGAPLIYVICFIVVKIIKRIPVLKKIVP